MVAGGFRYDVKVGAWLLPCLLIQLDASRVYLALLGAAGLSYAAFDLADFAEGAVATGYVWAGCCSLYGLVAAMSDEGGFIEFFGWALESLVWLAAASWLLVHASAVARDCRRTERLLLSLAGPVCATRLALLSTNDFCRVWALLLGVAHLFFAAEPLKPYQAANKKKDDSEEEEQGPVVTARCASVISAATITLPALSATLSYKGSMRPLSGMAEIVLLLGLSITPSLAGRGGFKEALWWSSSRSMTLPRLAAPVAATCLACAAETRCDASVDAPLYMAVAAAAVGVAIFENFGIIIASRREEAGREVLAMRVVAFCGVAIVAFLKLPFVTPLAALIATLITKGAEPGALAAIPIATAATSIFNIQPASWTVLLATLPLPFFQRHEAAPLLVSVGLVCAVDQGALWLWMPLLAATWHCWGGKRSMMACFVVAAGSVGAAYVGASKGAGGLFSVAVILLAAPIFLLQGRDEQVLVDVASTGMRLKKLMVKAALCLSFAVVVVYAPREGGSPHSRARLATAGLAIWASSATATARIYPEAPLALRFAAISAALASWIGVLLGCFVGLHHHHQLSIGASAIIAGFVFQQENVARYEPALVSFVVAANAGSLTASLAAALMAASVVERERPALSLRLYLGSALCCFLNTLLLRHFGLALAFGAGSAASSVLLSKALSRRLEDTLNALPKLSDAFAADAAAAGSYLSALFVFSEVQELRSVAGALASPLLLLLDGSYWSSVSLSLAPEARLNPGLRGVLGRAKFVPVLSAAGVWLAVRTLTGSSNDMLAAACSLPAWAACAQLSLFPEAASSSMAIVAWPLSLAPVVFAQSAAPRLLGAIACAATSAQLVARHVVPFLD